MTAEQRRQLLAALGAAQLLVAGCTGPAAATTRPAATSAVATASSAGPGSVVPPDAAQALRSTARQVTVAKIVDGDTIDVNPGKERVRLLTINTPELHTYDQEPKPPANWAQIRVGAAIAHLLLGSLEGAEEEVTPVFALLPELRVATVTAYTTNLGRRLRTPSYRRNKTALALCDAIRDFNRDALADKIGV